jgi:hypothetical protein
MFVSLRKKGFEKRNGQGTTHNEQCTHSSPTHSLRCLTVSHCQQLIVT